MRFTAFLVCLATGQMALADVDKAPAFASICIEDEGVGFSWRNGAWQQSFFTEMTYVVRKIYPEELRSDENQSGCPAWGRDPDYVEESFAFVDACYSRGQLGETPYPSWCREYYEPERDSSWKLKSVDCSEAFLGTKITFEPNGPFVYHLVHTDVSSKPENDYKDSLKISHGKCSVVR